MRANQNPQQTRNGRPGEVSPMQVGTSPGPRGMQSGAQRRQAHGVRRVGGSRPKKPNMRPTRAGRHCRDPSHRAAAQAGLVSWAFLLLSWWLESVSVLVGSLWVVQLILVLMVAAAVLVLNRKHCYLRCSAAFARRCRVDDAAGRFGFLSCNVIIGSFWAGRM